MTDAPAPGDYLAEVESHRRARERRLSAESSWLTIVDRHPLSPGANELSIGVVFLESGAVRLVAAGGVRSRRTHGDVKELEWTKGAEPDVLEHEGLEYELVHHAQAYAVRVRDPNSAARRAFHGLDFFEIDRALRCEGRFEPYDPPRVISLEYEENVVVERPCPGAVAFRASGQDFRLDPIVENEQRLLVMFRDATNRTATYGGGRFLYAALPERGRVILDFNKAFNPPCAFTPYVACPLVPPQNRLPIAIEAGEKRYE